MDYLLMFFGFSFTVFMAYQIFTMVARNKKNVRYMKVINNMENEAEFFPTVDAYISSIHDHEFRNKALIIKLWSVIYFDRMDDFKSVCNEIDLKPLMYRQDKVDYKIIAYDEDAYFYLLFMSNIALYSKGDFDSLKRIEEKVSPYHDVLKDQLFHQIYMESLKLYYNQDDLGKEFFVKVLSGEYEGRYFKHYIGLYKNVVACFLAKISILTNEFRHDEMIKSQLTTFKDSKLGNRIMTYLDLHGRYGDVK